MRHISTLFLSVLISFTLLQAQEPSEPNRFDGLSLRSIGPAFMSGRIGDVAIHPDDDNIWYVAVASGGVWKTENAGVTFTPIFEDESVYSIGCITIDPHDPNVIWVGTGENLGGRHFGWGDGLYRSPDAGQSWEHVGLPKSEHISKIIVHPADSQTIWVASQGPLWSKGGERGLYKSTDGGHTWRRTLGDEAWTGVTDVMIDPRDPNRIYAATWDRHRTVAAYMGGGPGSGIHRSDDGGETWTKLTKGLPTSHMGKIGLAISPQRPDVVYAAIELDRRSGGVYRSADGGATWTKRSDAVSGATGPHYYQELYASPHAFDRLYLMDVRIQVSDDGGKTFRRLTEEHKHSDNHAMAFRKDDPDYLLVGTDGGLYESFDLAKNWRFMANLPLTQFYKLAVDDAEPFYNVYGGTQDNSTEGGPSRTDNVQGIQNSDWRVVLDWDGHQPATEPGNPNIVYGQRQQGNLARIDMTTGEVVAIQPQPAEDEDQERYNWDAPIFISPHSPTRLYFGAQRLWRSDNRGDNWTAVSTDLTRDEDRLTLPIMGGQKSIDNPWDLLAMSTYNTITSIAESPIEEGLLYVGTDDGIIQMSDDDGATWTRTMVSTLPGVPGRAYVNDIKADKHDADVVYVALDNHKEGDYRPYLFKSSDRGRSWTSLTADLPEQTIVWRIVQDHVAPNLLFIGTEYGIYTSLDGGTNWEPLSGNVPTIPFRDLAIQARETDLVGASFGRGFYILDDYTALREMSLEASNEDITLFTPRKAWWYIPRSHLGFSAKRGNQGADHFVADNPDFGAVFTYEVTAEFKTSKEKRQQQEKASGTSGNPIAFPGWEVLAEESMEEKPFVLLSISDMAGNVIRRIKAPATKGMHRANWDLRYPAPEVARLESSDSGDGPRGMLAAPGKYTVDLAVVVDGEVRDLMQSKSFDVVPLRSNSLEGPSIVEAEEFWREYEDVTRDITAVQSSFGTHMKRVGALENALLRSAAPIGTVDRDIAALKKRMKTLQMDMYGHPIKLEMGEKTKPTIGSRMMQVGLSITKSTYGPTQTAKDDMIIVKKLLTKYANEVSSIDQEITKIADQLVKNGAAERRRAFSKAPTRFICVPNDD
ncbi:MAG: glycosyl hydrolase, partial [Bacteroidota bacterium]